MLDSSFLSIGALVRRQVAIVLAACSLACYAQREPVDSAPRAEASASQAVFHAGPGIIAPKLIPPRTPVEKIHHCDKLDGKPVIALVVDANGNPSRFLVTQPAEGNLNEAALSLVAEDRFKPGMQNGLPVAVAIDIEVELKTCSRYAPDGSGALILASLRQKPIQKLTVSPPPSPEMTKVLAEPSGGTPSVGSATGSQPMAHTIAPIPLNAVGAKYTDAARKAKITGSCLIGIVVDSSGMPQHPQILKGLDPGLDQEAIKAVMQYRFKPATRDGQPVPVHLTIQISFKIR
jgi:TonB family protein